MIKITEPIEKHVQELANNAREEEIKEVFAASGDTIYGAAIKSISQSVEVYSVLDVDDWGDGRLLGITGLVPYNTVLGNKASPWLLTTVFCKQNPRHLLRYTKNFVHKWRDEWPILENFIDTRYEASLRWAKWAGFTVEDPAPYGPFNFPFNRIHITRKV